MKYSKDDGMSHPRSGYRKSVASVLHAPSCSPLLLALREACYYVVSCLWQGARTEGGLWPTSSEELRPSGQQPHKELNPVSNL